jgi:hypothetical protein
MTEGIPAGVRGTPDGRTVVNPEEITAGDEFSPYADTLRPEQMGDTELADTVPGQVQELADTVPGPAEELVEDPASTLRSPTETDRPPAEPAPQEPSGDGPDVDPEVEINEIEVDESIPPTERSPGNELIDVEEAEGAATEGGEVALEGGEVAETAAVATETAETGLGLAEGLTAFGESILAVEAAGGAEVEAVTGPPGWLVGGAALAVAGAAIGAGYLLSDDESEPSAPAATEPASVPDQPGYDGGYGDEQSVPYEHYE